MKITPFEITCVILSGGKSSRMGEDKSLLPFSTSKTLIEYQYQRLKPHFKDIYISSKTDKFDFIDKDFLIFDEDKEVSSPILALDSIFKRLKNQKVFIIPVDTPFVSIESISKLIEKSKEYDICVAQTQKVHNLCGVFSSNISFTIEQMIEKNMHRISYLIENNKYLIQKFLNNDEFININNQIDYKESLKYINKTYNN